MIHSTQWSGGVNLDLLISYAVGTDANSGAADADTFDDLSVMTIFYGNE